jgi:hypothetical protein
VLLEDVLAYGHVYIFGGNQICSQTDLGLRGRKSLALDPGKTGPIVCAESFSGLRLCIMVGVRIGGLFGLRIPRICGSRD